jgi:uncharacterized protein (TIGR02118 family)
MSATTSNHLTNSNRSSSRRAILKSIAGGAAGAAFLAAGWTVDAAGSRAAFETGSAPVLPSTVKLVFVFGHPEDSQLFESYYRTTHVPLALKMPNFLSHESALAVSDAGGGKSTFYRIDTMSFANEDDMVSCVASKAGLAAMSDVANFATGGVTATVVSTIQSHQSLVTAVESTEVALPKQFAQ